MAARIIFLVLILSLLAFSLSGPAAQAQPAPAPLYLHRNALPATARINSAQLGLFTADPHHAIIQFTGPVGDQTRAALVAHGLTPLEYIPQFAFLVHGAPAQLATAANLPAVRSVTPLVGLDKLAPNLMLALVNGQVRQPITSTLLAWPGREAELAAALAARSINPDLPLSAAQIQQIAGIAALRWIEPAPQIRLLNDQARQIVNVEAAWQDHGLYGAGQIVGYADTGLDTGDLSTLSADFAGRVLALYALAEGTSPDDNNGHGTHVAGSLTGSGVLSGANPAASDYVGSHAGMAPQAQLVVQAFEVTAEGGITGLNADTYPLFAQAYAAGVRIHNNSWGGMTGIPYLNPSGTFGGYPLQSQSADAFIWDHPDMAIFFAAGNSGNDGWYSPILFGGCLPIDQDGVIDPDSLTTPATAKNGITVGASENLRSDVRTSVATWRMVDPTCYGLEPLANDLISDNANGIAAFSSRGPVDDGRMKPDLVAPGINIVSARSRGEGAGTLWGAYPQNEDYVVAGGTSMASPITAGAGALVREWLIRQGHANPSAALIKATLLNTTTDIAPGQYGTGAKQEIPFARPNHVAGWGRLDLGFLSAPEPYRIWTADQKAGLTTGESISFTNTITQPLVIHDSSQPLRVMLAWSDPPASLSSSRQLVNDLDLMVTGPDGRQFWGNNTNGGDRINNVEGVIIAQPTPGTYTISVRAHNIPVEAQHFALAVAGALQSDLLPGDDPPADDPPVDDPPGDDPPADDPPADDPPADDPPADDPPTDDPPTDDPPLSMPTARNDQAQTSVNTAVQINVLANDNAPNDAPLQISAVGQAQHGSVVIVGTALRYKPLPGFTGTDTFSYTIRIVGGGEATAQVQVTVLPAEPELAPTYYLYLPLLR
jgi:subtilisin family serine protease